MDVDEVLSKLGKWGKWQMGFYLILSIADTFPAAWHMLAVVFVGKFMNMCFHFGALHLVPQNRILIN